MIENTIDVPAPGSARAAAAALADATPDHRDRVVDLVRVVALAAVVLGHWLMASVTWRHGELHGANALDLVPWARRLTWVLQVMPLFFVAGGVANAASWESARRRAIGYPAWLHGRVERLLRPVAVFAGAWVLGCAVAVALGVSPSVLSTGARLVAQPLWFLAVYVVVVALAPAMLAAHRRWGLGVVVALAGAAAVVDLVRYGVPFPAAGWLNFAFVWLFAHQLGFWWRDGRLRGRTTGRLLTAAGFGGLLVLTTWGGYPVSMVGSASGRSNGTPPSFAIVALAVAQVGLLVLARPRLERALRGRALWQATIAANGVAMTAFLWHLTALAFAALLLVRTGLFPQPAVGSGAWWAWRPVWLAVLGLGLAGLLAIWSRFERPPAAAASSSRIADRSRPGREAEVRAAAGAAVVGAGFALVSANGLPVLGGRVVWPATGLVLLAGGAAVVRGTLLRQTRPRPAPTHPTRPAAAARRGRWGRPRPVRTARH